MKEPTNTETVGYSHDLKIMVSVGILSALVALNIPFSSKPIPIFSTGLTIIASSFTVGLIFIMSDVLTECAGRERAIQAVRVIVFVFVLSTVVTVLVGLAPSSDGFEYHDAFRAIFAEQGIRVAIGGPLAIWAGQRVDVDTFSYIKREFGGPLWVRNISSTLIGSLVSTVIAALIFFVGTGVSVFSVWAGMYVIRILSAVVDTPVVYVLSWLWRRQ